LENAKQRIGELLGAKMDGPASDRVILTSGGTEANNLALMGLSMAEFAATRSSIYPRRSHVVYSAIEHASVTQAADHLAKLGVAVHSIGVDSAGVILARQLAAVLDEIPPGESVRLASATLANSETGVIQPIGSLAEMCRQHGVAIHTDATQAIGKSAIDFRRLGVAAMTCAAHKFNGPMGIGALILHNDAALAPQLHGGFQQAGFRPGTETTALAIGMQTALEAWHRDADALRTRLAGLRDRLQRNILAGYPAAALIGQEAPRLPHTANIAFVGLDGQELAMALDLDGVACSTGSACASGSSQPSPAHVAMGLDDSVARSAIRFSLGIQTSDTEIDLATERILKACNRLHHRR
jgi:cysteine desulfurase